MLEWGVGTRVVLDEDCKAPRSEPKGTSSLGPPPPVGEPQQAAGGDVQRPEDKNADLPANRGEGWVTPKAGPWSLSFQGPETRWP